MKVDRILETAIYAEDLKAAEAFYHGTMGMEVYGRVAGRHVFFTCGAGMFLVFNPKTTEQELSPHGCRGIGHVAWAIREDEFAPWLERLTLRGVAVNDFHWPEGGRSLFFKDPAGNSLELTTPSLWKLE